MDSHNFFIAFLVQSLQIRKYIPENLIAVLREQYTDPKTTARLNKL
jgi:hypothetical protein